MDKIFKKITATESKETEIISSLQNESDLKEFSLSLSSYRKFLVLGSIILIGTIIVSAFIFLKAKTTTNDLSEIEPYIDSSFVEYKSERGFGNDRFDIYSFKLEKSNENDLFHLIDNKFQSEYAYFESMVENINRNEDNSNTNIKEKLNNFMSYSDTKYYSKDLGGTKKLYLYNEKMNKGYCLILTI